MNDRERKSLGDRFNLVQLEIGHSYRFPLIECLIVFFIFISFSAVNVGVAMFSNSWDLKDDPGWNGTKQIEDFEENTSSLPLTVYTNIMTQFYFIVIYLIPLLVAFTSAKAFEDGTLQTLLSFPIRRSRLLIMRTLLPVILLGGISTGLAFAAMWIFVPIALKIEHFLILTGTLWTALFLITATTMLIVVISKRMAITAVVGLAVWSVLSVLIYNPAVPLIVSGTANPVGLAFRYFLGVDRTIVIGDIYISILMGLLVAFMVLVLSVNLFERAEV